MINKVKPLPIKLPKAEIQFLWVKNRLPDVGGKHTYDKRVKWRVVAPNGIILLTSMIKHQTMESALYDVANCTTILNDYMSNTKN